MISDYGHVCESAQQEAYLSSGSARIRAIRKPSGVTQRVQAPLHRAESGLTWRAAWSADPYNQQPQNPFELTQPGTPLRMGS